MGRLIAALLLSLVAVLTLMPRVLPMLNRLKFGQPIYTLGPESHQAKKGTPTMGGLVFAAVASVFTIVLHGTWYGKADFALAIVSFSVLSMLIGFVDDFIKVVQKNSKGLIWWKKVVGQVVIGAAFSWYCYRHPAIGSSILIPFTGIQWDLGVWYLPLMTLLSMFMINSANLQDGLDGLLTSVNAVGSTSWAALALLSAAVLNGAGDAGNYRNVALFAFALVGASLGFLWFNYNPAKVFMGDTGSMFIGGATVAMAMVLRMPLFMAFVSFTMVASSASVILQRVYFKWTHGKRIIKMSPIHHHFELSGMTEPQVVTLYAAVTGLLSIMAVLSFVTLS